MTMAFIWIKIFYDFRNVIFSKRDRRKTISCSLIESVKSLLVLLTIVYYLAKKLVFWHFQAI